MPEVNSSFVTEFCSLKYKANERALIVQNETEIRTNSEVNDLDVFEVDLFPNPTNGVCNINVKGLSLYDMNIIVLNLQGNQLLNIEANNSERSIMYPLNLSALSAGSYLISIKSGNKSITKKLVKL